VKAERLALEVKAEVRKKNNRSRAARISPPVMPYHFGHSKL